MDSQRAFAGAVLEQGHRMLVANIDGISIDEALEWAARCPAAATGAVEVRPVDAASHDTIVAP